MKLTMLGTGNGIPELALLHYELPATEYPFDGDKDFILHKVVTDNYNAGSRNVTVSHRYSIWRVSSKAGAEVSRRFVTR